MKNISLTTTLPYVNSDPHTLRLGSGQIIDMTNT